MNTLAENIDTEQEPMTTSEALPWKFIAMSVIAQAFKDLRIEEIPYRKKGFKTSDGSKRNYNVNKLKSRIAAAARFLSGDSGSLDYWCSLADLDPSAVTDAYINELMILKNPALNRLHPDLRAVFSSVSYFSERGLNHGSTAH